MPVPPDAIDILWAALGGTGIAPEVAQGTAASSAERAGVIVLGLGARMLAAVLVGTRFLLPELGPAVRVLLALVLAAAAWPAALAADLRQPAAGVVAGELLVGLGLGTAAAVVAASAAWAGTLLGASAGLTWADDVTAEGAGESAGTARLAWWLGLSGWCAAGGPLAAVSAVVDGVVALPIGSLGHAADPASGAFGLGVTAFPAVAWSLALALALPALVAVLTFHVASAVCLRTIRFDPGAGLLQGLSALVLLSAVLVGMEHWSGGWGRAVTALASEAPAGPAAGAPPGHPEGGDR